MNRKRRRAQAKKANPAPQNAELFAAALRQHQAGNWQEAAKLYSQALKINPSHTKSLCNLGSIFLETGNIPQAILLYRQAAALEPQNPGFFYNLGTALAAAGELEEAMIAYEKAIQLKPDYPEAWNNLGGLFKRKNNLNRAERSFRQALSLQPAYKEAFYNLCRILLHQDRHEEARSLADAMILRYPGDTLLKLKRLSIQPMIPEDEEAIEVTRAQFKNGLKAFPPISLDERMDELLSIAAEPSFHLNYQGHDNLEVRRQYAALFRVQKSEIRNRESDVFRVGILVTDWHEGIFLNIMGGILNHWVNNNVNLTVISSPSGSKRLRMMITNPRILFLPVPTHCFRATLHAIQQAAFNLLFYWEVGSDPLNYFLPFFRPAPIQCTAWGTADTTGIPTMDYFISSHLQEPEEPQRLYSERLVLFEHMPCWFKRPDPAKGRKKRADFGFTESEHVFIVPQNPFKIHPAFDMALADILRKDCAAKIVLMHDAVPQPGEKLMRRLKRFYPHVSDRIVMFPRQDEEGYFSLLKMADVMLDPFHFGGGATTLEALAFGTPIVTWPGTHLRGRSTLACYRAMGFLDLVADSAADYVEKAVQLAMNSVFREQAKQSILKKNHCLYENTSIIEEFETFFLSLRSTHSQ